MRPPHPTDYFAWVERFAIAHHHKEAFWHLVLSGPAALDAVRAGLAHDDPAVRAGCTKVLDHLVDDDALDDLVAMLDDDVAEIRLHALHALACDRCKANGCMPTKESVLPAAIERLRDDPSQHVRAMAIGAIGRWVHDDPGALDAIVAAHESDPHPNVRKTAGWYVPGGPLYEKSRPRTRAR